MSDDWVQEQIAWQHLGMPPDDDNGEKPQEQPDPWDITEFLMASCRDIETGELLENTARPDLYVADVLTVVDEYTAMKAEIELLRARVAKLESA